MREYISVNKNLMPYSISIALEKDVFTLRFSYNKIADRFTVALEREGKVLTEGEPIVYGIPLFDSIHIAGLFPALNIVPYSESELYDEVTWDHFNGDVRLTIDRGT